LAISFLTRGILQWLYCPHCILGAILERLDEQKADEFVCSQSQQLSSPTSVKRTLSPLEIKGVSWESVEVLKRILQDDWEEFPEF
jgi:hypothetical protein